MTTINDTAQKDEALRRMMQQRRERREDTTFPKELENRVMERIYASTPASDTVVRPRARSVRLWTVRAVGVAAAVAGVFFFVDALRPTESLNVSPRIVAKVEEIHRPIGADVKEEGTARSQPQARPLSQAHSLSSCPASLYKPPFGPSARPLPPHQGQTSVRPSSPAPKPAEPSSHGEAHPTAKAEDEVCISCELDAMSCELTAMIDGFEKQ